MIIVQGDHKINYSVIIFYKYKCRFNITHRDGTKEPFNADHINRSIERASFGLTDVTVKSNANCL
jgi:hypothetical protein